MNLKEYEAQLALGTVDFRRATQETQSSTVLQDIIGRTDDIAVLCAVATNPKTNIYTLTLLATFPGADEGVVLSCVYHSNVTLSVLERWMKYPTIKRVRGVQQRFRTLQLSFGVSEKDAFVVENIPIGLPDVFGREWAKLGQAGIDPGIYPSVPRSQKEYVIWTTTGSNSTIEIDNSRFNFTSDPKDATIYYSYTHSDISVPPVAWVNENDA